MANTNPARGTRDFLPSDVRKREFVTGIIREVYEKYGFEPLETPTLENLATLTNKYGEEGDQLMFRVLKRGRKLADALRMDPLPGENDLADLALRYDLTVPLARVVANYRDRLPKYFRRYQIQPVWRADRPARGRFREFYQCDVDTIGSDSMAVEAELCEAINDGLERLGFEDFTIKINDRRILDALLDVAGIDQEAGASVLVSLDKLDKIGTKGVIGELEGKGLVSASIDTLFDLIGKAEDASDPLRALSEIFSGHDGGSAAVRDLEEIVRLTGEGTSNRYSVRPSLARGLSYYTGAIFEIEVPDLAGSLGGGGRYDGLIGMFGKEAIPACGFSLGLERIVVVMEERGMFPQDLARGPADVMVTLWDDERAKDSLRLARELREAGIKVLVYPRADKIGKQFKYADQTGVRFVCVIGEDEVKTRTVVLKDLTTGEQRSVPREKIGDGIETASRR